MWYSKRSIFKLWAYYYIIIEIGVPVTTAIRCYACSSYSSSQCLTPILGKGLPTEECSESVKTCSTEITSIDYAICHEQCFDRDEPEIREDIVIRGCTAENVIENYRNNIIDEKINNVFVKTCPTSLCNDEYFYEENCIRCRSSQLNGSCFSNFTKEMMVTCQKIVTVPNGCFAAVNTATSEVIRDCVSTFRTERLKHWDEHEICFGDFCNSRDFNKTDEILNKIEENVNTSEIEPEKTEENSNESTENWNQSEENINTSSDSVNVGSDEKNDKSEENSNTSIEEVIIENEGCPNKTENIPEDTSSTIDEVNLFEQSTQWCLQCKSEIVDECSVLRNPNKFEKECKKSDQSNEQKGCFTKRIGTIITRGCQNQLVGTEFDQCRQMKWCRLCSDNNCNDEQIFSSSKKLSINYITTAMLFISTAMFR